MKNMSLKLDDEIYSETEQLISKLHKSRNRYINEALEYYNKVQRSKLLAEQLQKESKLVSADSMKVLSEFETLDHEEN